MNGSGKSEQRRPDVLRNIDDRIRSHDLTDRGLLRRTI
jgi:hypothetical protein